MNNGITGDTEQQKGIQEFDRYATRSLVFSICALCLLLIFLFSGLIIQVSNRMNGEIIGNLFFIFDFFVIPIAIVVLPILGLIFGKKGLISKKVKTAKVGLVISIIELSLMLIAILWFIIYLASGGEFM